MTELLALTSAMAYGVADFLGGFATKRRHVLRVLAVAHSVGLAVVLGVALIGGGSPGLSDLWWGAAAGSAGLVGLGFFYWSLAIGTMGVVAPVTAAVGAAIPVVVGLVIGERPAPSAALGVVATLGAIVLVSAGDSTGWIKHPAAMRKSLIGAVVAGGGFGFFFVLLSQVDAAAGMWPLVAARSTSTGIVVVLLLLLRPAATPGGVAPSSAAGVLDITANVFVLAAFNGGMLVIVSALAALYPAVTVLLARFVLHERLRPVQLIGLVLAITAVAMISVA
ncbi:MAG: EamA/RhaT family transporter [Acidimicrobiia bacterium]|nr:EamA/RhaT family transporter [Acidimicrobiia bacterium]